MEREPVVSDFAEDALEVYLARYPPRSHAVYVAVLALVLATIGLLPVIRVSVTVGGQGVIRPMTEKHEVRARVSGLAGEVMTRRGATVARGQPLITLQAATVEDRAALLERQRSERKELMGDLIQLSGQPPARLPNRRLRTLRYREEHAQLLRELDEISTRSRQARLELDRAVALAERGLIPTQQVEEGHFRIEQLDAEAAVLVGRHASLWSVRLSELRREIEELEGELRQLGHERTLFTIEAPVSGTLEELSSFAAGSFIQAGEVVGVVSPDTALIAEVYLQPRDVGLVHVGMPVRLHVDAFPFHDWGFLTGSVVDVSDDYVSIERSPAFRVGVRLHRRELQLRNGFRGELKKGMTLQARFLVTDRTLLQLLRDDVNDWLRPWQAERPVSAQASRLAGR